MAVAVVLIGCSNPSSLPISVSLSPSTSQVVDQGKPVSITTTVTNDRSLQGVKWSLNGVGSLSGSTSLSVTYTPPPPSLTLTGAQQATVTATSMADPTKSASLTITVNPPPAIGFSSLANGTVGTSYSEIIQFTGGTAPFQWGIYNGPISTGWKVGGAVPDGLTLDPNTGTISGTPTAAGTWYFEVTVTDADGNSASASPSIQINPLAVGSANPVPLLNQPLVPAAVTPGSPGITLNVSGAGFVSGATVDLNGVPLTTTFVDHEHLSALLPAASVATAETASVTAVNPLPGGGSSNVVYFQVGVPATTISFANAPNSPLQMYDAT